VCVGCPGVAMGELVCGYGVCNVLLPQWVPTWGVEAGRSGVRCWN